MPNTIQHKRSSTSGVTPAASGLFQGELAINLADGKLYTKNNTNTVINLGVTSVSGTYITPASGNFSNSLKVNGVEVSVSGHNHDKVTSAGSLSTAVFNNTGSTISKFSVVYINGGQGDQPTINLAIGDGESGSSKTYGITAEAISNMASGTVIVAGALTGVNTDQFNPTAPVGNVNGSGLWLSPSVSGGLTLTKPSAPNHAVYVATIVRTHQNAGVVEVRVQNGFELQELHNVSVESVGSGQFLYYNGTSELWEPEPVLFSDGTNIGIGTSSPAEKLDIDGTIKSLGFKSYGLAWIGSSDGSVGMSVNDNPEGTFGSSSSFAAFQGLNAAISAYNPLCITTNYSPQLYLNTDGNTGVGTTTPYSKLQVNGSLSVAADGQDVTNGSEGIIFGTDGSISAYDSGPGPMFSLDQNNGLSIYGNGGAIPSNGIILSTDRSNLRIGIGTSTPDSTLHVAGDVNIDGNLTFDSYTESVVANGNSGTSKTLSLASGTVHTCTLTGNCTFTMPTATAGKSFSLFLNSGAGNYTATFTGVRWADSATPTATITASKVDIYSFISDGTYWYGSFSQNYG
jgi:hypothetical protein